MRGVPAGSAQGVLAVIRTDSLKQACGNRRRPVLYFFFFVTLQRRHVSYPESGLSAPPHALQTPACVLWTMRRLFAGSITVRSPSIPPSGQTTSHTPQPVHSTGEQTTR